MAVERSTKAYPTARVVRGLVGMDVDSLSFPSQPHMYIVSSGRNENSHKVALEEFLEIPLSGRVRQVANVQTTSLSDDGKDSFILSCVDRFTTGQVVGSGIRFVEMLLKVGVGQSVGDILHCRHVDWVLGARLKDLLEVVVKAYLAAR